MKNTLLTLMLVSSLFVISCGADATKPQDAYKNQPTETTGTKTADYVTVSVDAASTTYNTINIESLVRTPGEKVTEIVQVVTETTGTGATTTTTNTNAVTATTKNADGGIYKFTIDSTATTTTATRVTAKVTYKYIQREAAPIVVKETTGTYYDYNYGMLEINDPYFNDENKRFNKTIFITNKNNIQLISGTDYGYDLSTGILGINNTALYNNGDIFTIKYSYRDVEIMTDTPLKDTVTVDATSMNPTTATIQLDAATYAGRSYYLKAILNGTSISGTPDTETIYHNYANADIVPSTGTITVNATTLTSITSGTYEIWVY